jgi:RNA polymerase sigma factor (TIGR02999 family)
MHPGSTAPVTELLTRWSNGDRAAFDALIPIVHEHLLATARRYMARENTHHTLQSAALVNEAFLRMVDMRRVDWRDRCHFLNIAARIMRRILVDTARAKKFQKRGGGACFVSLDEDLGPTASPTYDLLGVDDALTALAAIDPRRARVVELRIFSGLTIDETAAALAISPDTVVRDWKLAKAWLARELRHRIAPRT